MRELLRGQRAGRKTAIYSVNYRTNSENMRNAHLESSYTNVRHDRECYVVEVVVECADPTKWRGSFSHVSGLGNSSDQQADVIASNSCIFFMNVMLNVVRLSTQSVDDFQLQPIVQMLFCQFQPRY